MVQVMPDPGPQIAQALAAIGSGLQGIIAPGAQFQIGMRDAMAKNPELLQQLADLEYQNPGSMERLGLGKLGGAVKLVKPTIDTEVNTRTREDQVKAKTGSVQLEAKVLAKMLEAGADPEMLADVASKKLVGQTTDERRISKVNADVAESRAGAIIAEAEQQRTILAQAAKNHPEIAGVNFMQEARDFLNGRLSGDKVAAYYNTPGSREAFTAGINLVMIEQREAAQLLAGGGTATQRQQTQEAFNRWTRSGHRGSLQAWQTFMFDPKARESISKILDKPILKRSPQEKDLLEVYQADSDFEAMLDMERAAMFQKTFADHMGRIKKIREEGGPDEVKTHVDALNDFLESRNRITGRNYRAVYEKNVNTLWPDSHDFYFADENGIRVDESVVAANLKSPNSEIQAESIRALTQITTAVKPEEMSDADWAESIQLTIDRIAAAKPKVAEQVLRNLPPDIKKLLDSRKPGRERASR